MSVSTAPRLTREGLEDLLQLEDASVILVSPRILRRVIKRDRSIGGIGLRVPHRQSYVLDKDALYSIVDPFELRVPPQRTVTQQVLLIERPESHELDKRDETLLRYWRRVYHIRIHLAIQRLRAEGKLDDSRIRERIESIGFIEYEEAKSVLEQEDRLWTDDLLTVYEEFVSLFFELRCFAPHRLRRYFPTIPLPRTEEILGEDVDGRALFESSRPEGAPRPNEIDLEEESEEAEDVEADELYLPSKPSEALYRKFSALAEQDEERGNLVRAALRRLQAAYASEQGEETRAAANATIERLANQLRPALSLSDEEVESWKHVLVALLEPAARGFWSREARLLYDLQKVCNDYDRQIYSVDVVEWVVSWGKRPIKELLPHQGALLRVKHVRSALDRAPTARVPEKTHGELTELLHDAMHHSEEALRDRLRPALRETLKEVGLIPDSFVEELEGNKVVEELLDDVVERGYLTMGLVRDAIARNRLKLPDLSGPGEFVTGDPLIQINRLLALRFAGIYHRGEIYLRWLQRFSSLFFAISIGRFLTKYLLLPFIGALFLLVFFEHLLHPVFRLFEKPLMPEAARAASIVGQLATPQGPLAAVATASVTHHEPISLVSWTSIILVGLFIMGMLYWPTFRSGVVWALWKLGRGIRLIFYDFPKSVVDSAFVQSIVQHTAYLYFYQYVFKPSAVAVLVGLLFYLRDSGRSEILIAAGSTYVLVLYLLLSRVGRHLEEAATDGMVSAYHLLLQDVLPGLYRLVVDLFRWFLEELDRLIYTVDEWLRFRGGQSRIILVVKGVLGLIWWFITYVIRFCVLLLIEPQINPIKHFPVVTVSHKLLLAVLEPTSRIVANLTGLSFGEALAATGVVFFGIPGIFGFFAWELKENWKLYEANESPTLDPEIVGSHGETIPRFLRPGFHSGTLPKLFAKLRRRPNRTGPNVRKYQEELHHIEEDIRSFVERDLIALLEGSKGWRGLHLEVNEVVLGTKRIRVEVGCPTFGGEPVLLDFELHGRRWLVASCSRTAWLGRLQERQLFVWRDALAGFYKRAGVSLVWEQLASVFPKAKSIRVLRDRLVLDGEDPKSKREYALVEEADLESSVEIDVPRERVIFQSNPLEWRTWVTRWREDRKGLRPKEPIMSSQRLLALGE